MNQTKVFVTADQHFGHKNVIEYENRPFSSVEKMDEALIKNWNKVVGKNDKVYVLGDVSFHGREKTIEIIQRLSGRKTLVMGNHDRKNAQFWMDCGFEYVNPTPIIYKDWFVMSHEPPHYIAQNRPYFHLYGHCHGSEMYKTITQTSACVCVERWEYTPVEFDKIMDLVKLA